MAGEVSSFLGGFTGSTIGSAVVRLYLDTGTYSKQLAATEAQTAGATTKAAGAFDKFKGVAVLAFAAVGAAAVQFVGQSIAAYKEHEVAVQRLGEAVGVASDRFEEQASALQMVTGFSDEAIIDATTLLSKYDLTTAQLEQLNPLVLDYARFTGIDATTAAGNLGKALLGNTRAIKSIGGEFEATGNRTEDLAVLMDILREKVGGTAEAFGQTAEGQAAILREKLEELKETIGEGLIPIIEDLTQTLSDFADVVDSDIARVILDMGERIRQLSSYVFTAKLEFKKFTQTVEVASVSTSQSAQEMERIIGKAMGANTKHVKRFADLGRKALHDFRESTMETFNTVSDVFEGLAEKARLTAGDVIAAFRKQNKALDNYAANVREVRRLGLEDEVLRALSEMGLKGAGILQALADASKREIDKVNKVFDTNVKKSSEVTNSITGVSDAVDKLDGKKADATVRIRYEIVGGINPASLPGLQTQGPGI